MLNWEPIHWEQDAPSTPGFVELRDLLTDGAVLPDLEAVTRARRAYASAHLAAFTPDEQRLLREILGDINANARLVLDPPAPAARPEPQVGVSAPRINTAF